MEKKDILEAILSKDPSKIAEAKLAIKETLTQRASAFKEETKKFVRKSLLESKIKNTDLLGPFTGKDIQVSDQVKGIFGQIHLNTGNTEHPVSVKHDGVEYHYGPEDIVNLVAKDENYGEYVKNIIKMFSGGK